VARRAMARPGILCRKSQVAQNQSPNALVGASERVLTMPRNNRSEDLLPEESRTRYRVLSYWRTRPAATFDARIRADIHDWLGTLSSTSPEWRAAIGGDAAAAIRMTLHLWPSPEVCIMADTVMTILLACALDNAAAASVLAATLRKSSLSRRKRTALAASWSLYHWRLTQGRGGRVHPFLAPKAHRRLS